MKRLWQIKIYAVAAVLLGAAMLASSCSIPNLETPECIEARPAVRIFYSFHFGNDMTFSPENLEARSRFLTERLKTELQSRGGTGDPFTTGDDNVPKAFRAGSCQTVSPDRVALEVLMLWRTGEGDTQKAITVEMQKIGDEWLVDKVIY
ncbi:MAG: hypothetical protein KF855_05080 [Acidobacteria bacterium]|nr:hypothetical protein [Acidobacteriota bacterium]